MHKVGLRERGPAQLFSHHLALSTVNNVGKTVVSGHASLIRPYVSPDRVMLDCGVDTGGPLVAWVSDINKLVTVL